MALLERVGTLLRANLNDLIDRAEDPEKMIKQIILDMENQLMQVKTQVAISIADLHLLRTTARRMHAGSATTTMRKAELAVAKQTGRSRARRDRASLDAKKRSPRASNEQIADQKVAGRKSEERRCTSSTASWPMRAPRANC